MDLNEEQSQNHCDLQKAHFCADARIRAGRQNRSTGTGSRARDPKNKLEQELSSN